MNKLLFLLSLTILMTACGASEEDNAKAQNEAEQRVNEIIKDLESSKKEAEAVKMDTTTVDSTTTEHTHDGETHDHAGGATEHKH